MRQGPGNTKDESAGAAMIPLRRSPGEEMIGAPISDLDDNQLQIIRKGRWFKYLRKQEAVEEIQRRDDAEKMEGIREGWDF